MWEKTNFNKWSLIMRSSDKFSYLPNHEHHDLLHFVLFYNELPVLVDSGRASYNPIDVHAKSYLPEYHNSIRIDGLGYIPDSKHLYPNNYNYQDSNIITKVENKTLEILIRTQGFNRIDNKINFTRRILVNQNKIEIIDSSQSLKSHVIDNYFHFHPQVKINKDKNNYSFKINNKYFIFSPVNKNKDKDISYFSNEYGHIEEKFVIHNTHTISKDNEIRHNLEIS
ncbi:MAG: hypothetical protein CMD88_02185 [Gammaproteobacteria bacterium]|nr:hypothetical protein [Gammaproteobacteria bacterium]|tara:strand:+ start:1018 stop:1692 length:675 start_codon:yes stop_codon:yes gene_type:complete